MRVIKTVPISFRFHESLVLNPRRILRGANERGVSRKNDDNGRVSIPLDLSYCRLFAQHIRKLCNVFETLLNT